MSMKRKFRLYNILMLIFPILVSLIVFELSTNFFEERILIKNENYSIYVENASEIISFARSKTKMELDSIEQYAKELGFSVYIVKDDLVYYDNLPKKDKEIIKDIKPINKDIVYQYEGKIIIVSKIDYDNESFDMYFISKKTVAPFISLALVQIFLIFILITLFIAVAISNYFFSGKLIKSLSKPLEGLSKSADKIREGDLSKPVGKAGITEMEELFQTFDLMRIELKNNIDKNIKYEKSKREMLAGISHDLKTPLTVIQGYSKGILDGVAHNEEQVKKYVEVINRKSIEMESLLNQLTIFSKLETKSFTFNFEKINLNVFLEQFIKTLKTESLNKKIKFEYVNHAKNVEVLLDTLQMHRVFDNIVSNSIKYNNNEIVIIKIIVYLVDLNEIAINIIDNGIGVDEKDIEHLFESFYRVDSSRSTKVEGNGLGLAICKNIIEEHKGKIKAYSDQGLTIKISLPIGEKHE